MPTLQAVIVLGGFDLQRGTGMAPSTLSQSSIPAQALVKGTGVWCNGSSHWRPTGVSATVLGLVQAVFEVEWTSVQPAKLHNE
jgi:hypothetical protein